MSGRRNTGSGESGGKNGGELRRGLHSGPGYRQRGGEKKGKSGAAILKLSRRGSRACGDKAVCTEAGRTEKKGVRPACMVMMAGDDDMSECRISASCRCYF